MDVAKFGGTSMADAQQWSKVLAIAKNISDLKVLVVSAPGHKEKDKKVTNLLLKAGTLMQQGHDGTQFLEQAILAYEPLAQIAGVPLKFVHDDFYSRYTSAKDKWYLGRLAAGGEYNCAKLFAKFCSINGLHASYVDPTTAGMILTPKPGTSVGVINEESYQLLRPLAKRDDLLIFPGYFGRTACGNTITFARGGSDVTGAVIARSISADTYWNYTDSDGARAAHPGIVPQAKQIMEITYEEMRELSAGGFEILQEETLQPLYREGIPVCIKNTNNPDAPGTWVVKDRRHGPQTGVIGIACKSDFMAFGLRKFGGNDQMGFGSSILSAFADAGVSYGYDPTGGDYVSVIAQNSQITPQAEEHLRSQFYRKLHMDLASVVHRNLAMVTIVGEGIPFMQHVLSRATSALEDCGINVETGTYAVRSKSVILGVNESDAHAAVHALYNKFIG